MIATPCPLWERWGQKGPPGNPVNLIRESGGTERRPWQDPSKVLLQPCKTHEKAQSCSLSHSGPGLVILSSASGMGYTSYPERGPPGEHRAIPEYRTLGNPHSHPGLRNSEKGPQLASPEMTFACRTLCTSLLHPFSLCRDHRPQAVAAQELKDHLSLSHLG